MVYGNLQSGFMRTEYNVHIPRYGTPICGNIIIVVYIAKSVKANTLEMRGILLLNSKWFLRRTCYNTWWRHQVETFSALLSVCVENSPVPGEFPAQRTVTRNFDVFFDPRPTKLLGKQSWGWWFDTPSRPSRRHRNELLKQKCCDEISDTTQEVRHNSANVDNLIRMTFSI